MKHKTRNSLTFSNRVRQFVDDIDAEAHLRAENILREITEGRTTITDEIRRRGGNV